MLVNNVIVIVYTTLYRKGGRQFPIGASDVFITTGDPVKMKTAAYRAFGVKIEKALGKTIP